jgi:hypothetical protein
LFRYKKEEKKRREKKKARIAFCTLFFNGIKYRFSDYWNLFVTQSYNRFTWHNLFCLGVNAIVELHAAVKVFILQ